MWVALRAFVLSCHASSGILSAVCKVREGCVPLLQCRGMVHIPAELAVPGAKVVLMTQCRQLQRLAACGAVLIC